MQGWPSSIEPWFLVLGVIVLLVLAYYAIYDHYKRPASPLPPRFGLEEIMQVAITLIILAAGLYIVLIGKKVGYDDADVNWAFGTIGTVVGFWLRPHRPAHS